MRPARPLTNKLGRIIIIIFFFIRFNEDKTPRTMHTSVRTVHMYIVYRNLPLPTTPLVAKHLCYIISEYIVNMTS